MDTSRTSLGSSLTLVKGMNGLPALPRLKDSQRVGPGDKTGGHTAREHQGICIQSLPSAVPAEECLPLVGFDLPSFRLETRIFLIYTFKSLSFRSISFFLVQIEYVKRKSSSRCPKSYDITILFPRWSFVGISLWCSRGNGLPYWAPPQPTSTLCCLSPLLPPQGSLRSMSPWALTTLSSLYSLCR